MFTKKKIGLGVLILLLVIVTFNGCSSYNKLVTLDETVENAWGNLQSQYQRRVDLIPNLVNVVDAYARHESQTFESVTRARAGLLDAQQAASALGEGLPADDNSLGNYSRSHESLNKAFSVYINAVHEAYPELKANENFRDLQVQLEGTENRIATQRQAYNDAIKEYNMQVRRFPANIWSGMFGFDRKPVFQADSNAQSAPEVRFN